MFIDEYRADGDIRTLFFIWKRRNSENQPVIFTVRAKICDFLQRMFHADAQPTRRTPFQ
jgi:hypothetical protein